MDILLDYFQNKENYKKKTINDLIFFFTDENERLLNIYNQTLKEKIFPLISDLTKLTIQKYRYNTHDNIDFYDNNKNWKSFKKGLIIDFQNNFYLNYNDTSFIDRYFCKLPNFKLKKENTLTKKINHKSRSFKSYSSIYLKEIKFTNIRFDKVGFEISFGIEYLGINKQLKSKEYTLEFETIKIERDSKELKIHSLPEITDEQIEITNSTFKENKKIINELFNKYNELIAFHNS